MEDERGGCQRGKKSNENQTIDRVIIIFPTQPNMYWTGKILIQRKIIVPLISKKENPPVVE
jgi:hypothetical protein